MFGYAVVIAETSVHGFFVVDKVVGGTVFEFVFFALGLREVGCKATLDGDFEGTVLMM